MCHAAILAVLDHHAIARALQALSSAALRPQKFSDHLQHTFSADPAIMSEGWWKKNILAWTGSWKPSGSL